MSMGPTVLLIIVVVVLLLFSVPEFWMLIRLVRERGLKATRVRLRDGLVGQVVRASRSFSVHRGVATGQVTTEGEIWRARCARPDVRVQEGDRLRIVARDGLTVLVEPLSSSETS